jgi:hypothetical protein
LEKVPRAVAFPLSFGWIGRMDFSSPSLTGGLNGGVIPYGLKASFAEGLTPKSNPALEDGRVVSGTLACLLGGNCC